MARLFGTDGVRGVANADLTPELAFRLGRAAAYVLALGSEDDGADEDKRIAVGRDTRASGDLLESALIAGILSAGVSVLRLGVVPTPGVARLTRTLSCSAGAMISASHNPVEDNGIKFFGSDGFKLQDEVEDAIEAAMEGDGWGRIPRPAGTGVGRIVDGRDQVAKYVEFLTETVRSRFDGLKVVMDCAYGAAYRIAPEVFRRLGAEVVVINDRPTGDNINVGCGSTHPEVIQEAVLRHGGEVGLSFDGDADRLIAVDEKGERIDGDHILAICARRLKQYGELDGDTVVATVMSNVGLEKSLKQAGISLVRTAVGDRYVMEEMVRGGYVLGGEQSGHIIFLRHNTTGDGILTALQLVDTMVASARPLSELREVMTTYPQKLVNVRVADKHELEGNVSIREEIRRVQEQLGRDGRVLVRPSGTEPLVRIMVEGLDAGAVDAAANRLAQVIQRELGSGDGPVTP
ncbi:phosphoglucosamine mutase [Kyrpidia spormannii]|uniref:Phosphoglucosamine mutase n=1 Tax=Kyrpidia spormannii TaxID=2055160 RepID=A0A6F9E0L8_9BACL|nr:phosphoglucosamine mutase [Kyrpidia spormannii]CAB3390038.1 phosphoglucosamine mutase [Kyrpidia spormannii]